MKLFQHLLASLFLYPLVPLAFCGDNDILIIESYHSEYLWDESYIKGIQSTINSKEYTFHRFQMNTKRVNKTEFNQKADEAWAYYQKISPRLVFLGDDNALMLLITRLGKESTPVVYLGINTNPNETGVNKYENVTGVLERPLFKKSIVQLKEAIPSLKNVLILFDDGTTSSAAIKEEFKGNSSTTLGGINVSVQQIGVLKEWKNTVLRAEEQGFDAIIIGLYHTLKDDNNKSVDAEQLLLWTSEYSPTPLFAFWDFAVGANKTIGGLVLYGYTQGETAAQMALKILKGKSPKALRPRVGEKGRYLYSKQQLKKWNISLPKSLSSRADFIE
ncbi:ABC transporter substrate-binding protein [Zooshikella ganghwensis]|uniref:Sugar ABC transporter n=1 Tax=Zooshikella ganghwensis TaxID=202772 RepID=A0A4P9VN55_9GAMM|nr:ABC transporter substrate binding protein [Zooshikella ganghwensis]RDH43362.1 sugar ABC transporter [Zooshikella ganghwensis]